MLYKRKEEFAHFFLNTYYDISSDHIYKDWEGVDYVTLQRRGKSVRMGEFGSTTNMQWLEPMNFQGVFDDL